MKLKNFLKGLNKWICKNKVTFLVVEKGQKLRRYKHGLVYNVYMSTILVQPSTPRLSMTRALTWVHTAEHS